VVVVELADGIRPGGQTVDLRGARCGSLAAAKI
jgi:hypothetical protein